MWKNRSYNIEIHLLWPLVMALVLPAVALAGGWALVSLDSVPAAPGAGVPFTVGFVVLQHGRTPLNGLHPTLHFSSVAGEHLTVPADQQGDVGHYVATVTLPTNGRWYWDVEAFGPPAIMAPLDVVAPLPLPPISAPRMVWPIAPLPVVAATTALLLLIVTLWYRRRAWSPRP
ncbi:MAG: hypothetical protein NVS2B7_22940 [Herpetosiphon sp.]